jgi:hypothetical protein
MAASMRTTELLLKQAAHASEHTTQARNDARARALRVVHELERRTVEAVKGDKLRGLTNIAPTGSPPFHGARVHGSPRFGIDTYLPPDGSAVLCIDRDGRLVMVRTTGGLTNGWQAFPVRDDELRAEDMKPYVQTLTLVLQRHVAYAGRRAESYARVAQMAAQVATALGFSG